MSEMQNPKKPEDITSVYTSEMFGNGTQISNESYRHYSRERDVCALRSAREVTVAEIIACAIAVLTVLENIIILAAITRGHRSLRKPPYWFIASLAVADLFTGFEVVMAVFVPIGKSPLSRIALKGLAVVTFIASVNSLVLVSMDRYIRIVHHSDYKKLLNRRTIISLILGSWMLSFSIFLVAPLLGWSCSGTHCCAYDGNCACLRSEFGDDTCGRRCSQSFVPFEKSYILVGVVYFALSVVVMTTFYGIIFKVVKKNSFDRADGKSQTYKKREVRLAKTLVITLGIFVSCWFPVQALFVVDLVIFEHNDKISKVFDYALVPSVINSFMNPIIYSVRLPHIWPTIQRMFLPCVYGKQRKNGGSWVSSTSMEKRSFRRCSSRRRSDRKRLKSASSSSGAKDQSPPKPTKERLCQTTCETHQN